MARAFLVSVLLFSACDLNHFRRDPMYGPDNFARELAVDLNEMTETRSGLRYQDLAVGTGEAAARGDEVVVHYTGWLPSGKKFDSSRDGKAPLTFSLGQGRVIEGWEEGIAGMRAGGRRKLLIPPKLGYGPQAMGPIPPNSTLVFDVELVAVR